MTSRMPKEIKDKWIEALRSGSYIQGKGSLYSKSDNAYCCLGVLQHCLTGDVERTESGLPAGLPSKKWLEDRGIKFNSSCYLTFIINEDVTDTTVPAYTLNDSYNYSFKQIADLVEEQVEGV